MEAEEKKETDEKFITTVDLTIPYSEKTYQFLYGSQLYGTLFAIYGRIDCSAQENHTYNVKGINFRLINYKGCVNMGFERIELDKEGKNNNNKLTINIYVRPLKCRDQMKFNKDFTVQNNTEILIQRWGMPYTERLSHPNEDGEMSRRSIFFDTEFNYRDGYYEVGNPPRDGQEDGSHPFPSPRCHQSNVRMTF